MVAIQPVANAEIVVTAERLPDQSRDERLGAIVLSPRIIGQSASGRLEDVLARIPSLQSFRRSDSRSANPSAQGLTLRGLGGNASSRTLVLLDGIPIADPFFGFVPLSGIDPQRLSAVTVMRGAGGGAFGSAVAGSITLVSLAPDARPGLDAGAGLSDDGATELRLGAAQRSGSTGIAFDARWDRGRGFWTTPEDQRTAASARAAYDSRIADVRLLKSVRGGTIDARLRGFADARTLRFDGADSSMRGLDGSLRYVAPEARWTIAGWHQRRDFTTIVVSATSFRPVLDQYATPATSSGALAQLVAAPGLTLGADVKDLRGTARERALASGATTAIRANRGRVREAALFAEGETGSGRLTLAASARLAAWTIDRLSQRETDGDAMPRFDRRLADRHGTALSGRATLAYAGQGWTARAAMYRGLRLPTLNELTRGFTVFPVVTRANPELDPERLTGAEIGLGIKRRGVQFSTTLFANRLAGAIGNVTLAPNLRERRNLGAIRSRGIEAELGWRGGAWGVDAAASLVRARVDEPGPLDGLVPAQVPARTATLTLLRDTKRTRLSATLRNQSRAFEDDANRDALPAATTLDLVARRQVSRTIALALRGENLFDARIVTRNQGGSIDLGAPRTVWLTLGWAFKPAPSPR